jgi:hypothetical protein
MSASTLRAAAALMRQLTEAIERDGGGWFTAQSLYGYHEPVNADLIATFTPDVARAAGHLFETVAKVGPTDGGAEWDATVTLARRVLGESA